MSVSVPVSRCFCPDGGMVDTEVSKSSASRLAGSSPALGTIQNLKKNNRYIRKYIRTIPLCLLYVFVFLIFSPMSRTKSTSSSGIWLDRVNPPLDEIDAVMSKYDFHELDRDAILESNQYARLDAYSDYIFLVLHFPKYDPNSERYIHNELNIFVSRDYLISFRYYQSATMKKVYESYERDLKV